MITNASQGAAASESEKPLEKNEVLVGDVAIRIGGPHRAGSSLSTELSTLRQIGFETFRGHLRDLKKNGQKARYDDQSILKPNIAAQMSSASRFKERSFPMLVDTYHELLLEAEDFELKTMCEELFEEMQQNKHDWDLFYSLENSLHVWAERSTGIFLKLANIYRSEKKFDECRQVMVQYKFIITQHNALINIRQNAGISDKDELVCVRELTFRYHRCAYRLAYATARCEDIAESLRFLLQYELDTKAGDEAEFLWIFPLLNCTPCTTVALKKASDADLQRVAVLAHRMGLYPGPVQMEMTVMQVPDIRSMTRPFNNTGLSVCAACKGAKSPSNILMQCARCKHVKYCSRECQKQHYPEHKEFCKIALIANPPKNK